MKTQLIKTALLLLYIFSTYQTYGQETKIDVTIHSRVDTTQKEIMDVVLLWINYLSSKPDSLYDNPFWNNAEKIKNKNFDLSREYLYQFPSENLLGYYKPTILTVEKEGDNYGIRTIFSADNIQEKNRNSTTL